MDIYVVNLDRRPDRWRDVSTHLSALGLAYSRVAAIDGSAFSDKGESLVPAAVDACWRSHQRAFIAAASGPASNSLVLEDDVLLSSSVDWPDFLRQVDVCMTRGAIDVLQLGWLPDFVESSVGVVRAAFNACLRMRDGPIRAEARDWWNGSPAPGREIRIVPGSFLSGAHCYAVSQKAARTLQSLNNPTVLGTDDFFTAIANDQVIYRRFRVARTRENLAAQRSRRRGEALDSDLEPYRS